MKRKIITTADGSKTIYIEAWDEYYHSKHGAIQEAQHVFIKNGFQHIIHEKKPNEVSILEMGFGTGLNAFLTCLEAKQQELNVNYVGIEAYPVSKDELEQLNYGQMISPKEKALYDKIHDVDWGKSQTISVNFSLLKKQQFFENFSETNSFDLIYFDAFGARVQPQLWSKVIFSSMYDALKPQGVLVTYAAIGRVRREMEHLGFEVERLQGPPGKRHMLRAVKL